MTFIFGNVFRKSHMCDCQVTHWTTTNFPSCIHMCLCTCMNISNSVGVIESISKHGTEVWGHGSVGKRICSDEDFIQFPVPHKKPSMTFVPVNSVLKRRGQSGPQYWLVSQLSRNSELRVQWETSPSTHSRNTANRNNKINTAWSLQLKQNCVSVCVYVSLSSFLVCYILMDLDSITPSKTIKLFSSHKF